MPAMTRLSIATNTLVAAMVMVMTGGMTVACGAAADQWAATGAALATSAHPAQPSPVPAQVWTPLPGPAHPSMGRIIIEHVTYQDPLPGVLFKMTDTAAHITCYYTAQAGIPDCLETTP